MKKIKKNKKVNHVKTAARELLVSLKNLLNYKKIDMFSNIEIETITKCNRKCYYCPNSVFSRGNHLMKEKLFKKIIDELSEIGFVGEIRPHFYGEPLLDKRLPKLVGYAKEKLPKAKIVIYSNGDFLTKKIFDELIASGVSLFRITIHDKKNPRKLKGLLKNLKATPLLLKKIVIKKNISKHPLSARGNLVTPKKINWLENCPRPKTTVTINYKGDVILCCDDYFSTIVFGNLKKEQLFEIWEKPIYKKARLAIKKGKPFFDICKTCLLK